LETNTQTSQSIEIVTKKEITIRTVLNIYGIFTVCALLLSSWTTPISINEDMQLFYNEDIKNKLEEHRMEFFLFILGSSLAYFSLVNLYYKFKR
jgi:hypothetical protein